ncbi:TRAP transporter small permease [Poseidonocella sp. HB161398]|uniref:TRAP transporter small permease n=1 Tax=Poseidonocella sp. HB161398 TaxID=2320855 RepID=UPI001F0D46FF|nr:TRAP transporter small permease [Poseidonocella sp. HB161398]
MIRTLDLVLRVIIIAIFSVLVGCVVWQVVSRYVLGTPSTVTDELARFLFMWLALIGGAYTLGQRRHLAIDFLTGALKGRAKTLSEGLILVIVALFAILVMIKGGWALAAKTLASGQVTPALQIPMAWVYGAIPFAGLVMLIYCGHFLAELARHGAQDKPDAPVGGPLD